MGAPPDPEFASWRAPFPTTDDAYAAAERPDRLARVAAEVIPVKQLLRALAPALRATALGSARGLLALAWPLSSPLELALAWAGAVDPLAARLRAVKVVSAAALVVIPLAIVADLLWLSSLSRWVRMLSLQGGFAVATLAVALVLERLRRAHARRALVAMTDARALDAAVATLAELVARRPPDRLRSETTMLRALLAPPRR